MTEQNNSQAQEIQKESEWVERARKGDLEAFSALVRLHQDRLVRLGYSVVGHWEDARDLAQEAFVRAFERLGGFRGECRFSTWLYRIMINLSKDHLRKARIRRFFRFGQGDSTESSNLEETVAYRGSHARDEAADGEIRDAVLRAALQLPFGQRTAFILRYLEGLELAEIAESMGLSSGAVKAHLWQAVQKMQKKLVTYREEVK